MPVDGRDAVQDCYDVVCSIHTLLNICVLVFYEFQRCVETRLFFETTLGGTAFLYLFVDIFSNLVFGGWSLDIFG